MLSPVVGSVTVRVTVAVPVRPAVGVTVRVRLLPAPPNTSPLSATKSGLLLAAS